MQDLQDKRSAVERLLEEFVSTADLSYRAFNIKLKVSSDPESILGIRMPVIRKSAKRIAKLLTYDDAIDLLLDKARRHYEYKMLLGLVLQEVTATEEVPKALSILYALCDGWATADLFKDALGHFAQQGALAEVEASIERYSQDVNPFARRLTIVAFLPLVKYKLVVPEVALAHITKLQADRDYYIEMANAWLLAELSITHPEVPHSVTSPTLLQKYRQKLRDSFRHP
ncbi:DNA alkylation repair protein [Porphyromonas levii]|uniref:DNA alkylation repair protein n=1 Tax=Porphyromonas levii TaxID=28114 RepID=A0A4Y8WPT4_9PORP|nr:DNA alkylation repair protein [Porphyromonas levii]MBR8702426.1 hypothetical protein [Porphyromonas levii]MBR8713407.1 hypothetical protein [Porphyromonas levii]MBR8715456.1 hypothetical protein [Porphyromonas levii]MBR8727981.1 hypothetical protein [Porphyromonas levii]MBR8731171.1 hypothetical protein [Porphyromonas levii]